MPGHIAALGSSFAAGPGIEPMADRAARRSARNYPHLLAERLDARLTDLTVSGATTDTIIDTRQRLLLRTFPPQVRGLPADADLVTITAGGNDLRYASSMIRLGYAGRLSSRAATRMAGRLLARQGAPRPAPADVERAASNLARIVDAVRGTAKGARVLLVDYLTVLGPDTHTSREAPFDDATLNALRDLSGEVERAFARAAELSGAELIRVSERSREHAIGSPEPWVTGLRPHTTPFHPNAAGMRAVADMIAGQVRPWMTSR